MNEQQNKVIGNHTFNIVLGVIGMMIACYGNLTPSLMLEKESYLLGACFLFTSALLERQLFFIFLQIIVLAGTAIAFTAVNPWLKMFLPIFLSVGVIIYFIQQGLIKDKLTLLGCIGIAFLAAGYAITKAIIFFLGSFILMVYSFASYRRGVQIALIWAILNAVFVVTASVAIYRSLM